MQYKSRCFTIVCMSALIPVKSNNSIQEESTKSRSCSLSLGRIFNCAAKVGKVALIATVAAMLLFTPVVSAVSVPTAPTAQNILPAQSVLDRAGFPPYFSRFVDPGEQMVRMGTAAFNTEDGIYTESRSNEIVTTALFDNIGRLNFTQPAPPRGYTLEHQVGDKLRKDKYSIPTAASEKYSEAVNFVDETFFNDLSPLEMGHEKLARYIMKIHSKLTDEENRFRDPSSAKKDLENFSLMLQRMCEQKVDPIAIAAVIQTEMQSKKIFLRHNEKVARILLNAVLIRYGGHPPVVFHSDNIYQKAVAKALAAGDHTLFERYLRNKEIPWTRRNIRTLKAEETYHPKTFPEDSANFLIVGQQLSDDGRTLCPLNLEKKPAKSCSKLAAEVYSLKQKELEQLICEATCKDCPILFQGMQFYINPHQLENFQRGYRVAARRILQNPNFFADDIATAIREIKYLHEVLVGTLMKRSGRFRNFRRMVYPENLEERAAKKVDAGELTPKEFAIFRKSYNDRVALAQTRDFETEELKVWIKAGAHLPSHPDTIQHDMDKLVLDVMLLIRNKVDPIYIASTLHAGITRIFPFNYFNGKLARLLFNGYLRRYLGIKPVLFPKKADYLEMTALAAKGDIVSFALWIQNDILPQQDRLYELNSAE